MGFGTAIAASVAGSLASGVAGSLLGGSSKSGSATQSFRPMGIVSPAYRVRANSQNLRLYRKDLIDETLAGLQGSLREQAGETRGLLPLVKPGYGRLTDIATQTIRDRERAAIGNLREHLARRRVLGSSFAQDALGRVGAEFAQTEEQIKAEHFLQELDLTHKLTNEAFTQEQAAFRVELDQIQQESEMAVQLAGGATASLGANARAQAMLDAQAAAGRGQFMGQITEPFINQFAQAVGGAFDNWSQSSSGASSGGGGQTPAGFMPISSFGFGGLS